MITLHEAIRSVQEELIKSQQERIQKGMPELFVTEKLTIELSCVFSETDSTDAKGGMNALSVLAFDASSANSVSSEEVQKITLEFKTVDPQDTGNSEPAQNEGNMEDRSIPLRESGGMYPYGSNR
ncbi:MAG: hypothetical protein HFH49_01480 [Lachnospiraceae bacterium]|nr:hypothetical protein [Lachnospiraceae bacterium]